MQLFCFTYAGGTTAFFNKFEASCNSDIEVVKLEYSGHGKRMNEQLFTDFDYVSNDLYDEIIKQYSGGEYALLGYSMGCFAAIDMYRHILECGELKKPSYIFLAAHSPKSFFSFEGMNDDEINEATKKRTIDFGEIPEKLIDNKSFWRIYLPIYRTDYQMICNYSVNEKKIMLTVPTLVFYSDDDLAAKDIKEWQNYSRMEIEYIRFPGKHFFINTYYKEMADIIAERLINR